MCRVDHQISVFQKYAVQSQPAPGNDILVCSVPMIQWQSFFRRKYEDIVGTLQTEIWRKAVLVLIGSWSPVTKTRSLNTELQGMKEGSKTPVLKL